MGMQSEWEYFNNKNKTANINRDSHSLFSVSWNLSHWIVTSVVLLNWCPVWSRCEREWNILFCAGIAMRINILRLFPNVYQQSRSIYCYAPEVSQLFSVQSTWLVFGHSSCFNMENSRGHSEACTSDMNALSVKWTFPHLRMWRGRFWHSHSWPTKDACVCRSGWNHKCWWFKSKN